MKKFIVAAAIAVAPMLGFAAPVFADSPGQLSNAPTNYEVKNVTRGGSYSQSTSATCNETVRYSVLLANSDFGLLRDLTVKANLATGVINASATNTVNDTTSVSGNVTVNVTKGSLAYVSGSTVRITSDGQTRTELPDGITSAGVNAGELTGSTQTFVQFDTKISCKTTPPQPGKITVCEINTGNIVTIDEDDYDSSKHTTDLSQCEEAAVVTELPQTGNSGLLAGLGLSALVAGGAYALQRRNILG